TVREVPAPVRVLGEAVVDERIDEARRKVDPRSATRRLPFAGVDVAAEDRRDLERDLRAPGLMREEATEPHRPNLMDGVGEDRPFALVEDEAFRGDFEDPALTPIADELHGEEWIAAASHRHLPREPAFEEQELFDELHLIVRAEGRDMKARRRFEAHQLVEH